MAEPKVKATNACECDTGKCDHEKPCSDTSCKEFKSCCSPGCQRCVKKKCEAGIPCQCYSCGCECQNDPEVKAGKRPCKESQTCKRCAEKCKKVEKGGRCTCYLCGCGIYCNGVNCQCCRWCNPYTTCTGPDNCDQKEDKHDEKECNKGMCAKYPGTCGKCVCKGKDSGQTGDLECSECKCSCNGDCPRTKCFKAKHGPNHNCDCTTDKHAVKCVCECICNCSSYGNFFCEHGKKDGECTEDNCEAMFYYAGKCRFKCTNCGKLCPQDAFRRGCYIGVPILVIVAIMVSVCRLYPGPFRKVYYGLRAALVNSFNSSGASTNLAGGRIHEEMDTDEYSAFPFKGLM
ncbi:hypothetical protein, conserved [Babesia ovata]|uniref:Uncharacterized protein n=1 Tax=Babesia ovata TaxID=189622 RepID=A0A2H6K875_9APIC|nr:uncharacterized protein BOVATA_006890 [Babesia ovata]GBE59196.1 hypothetical protein, conserved [Babesia ovata]